MTKKNKKKKKAEKKQSKELSEPLSIPSEWRGIILGGFTLALTLSLITFVDGDAEPNALGLLGYALARGAHYLLGMGAYLTIPLFAWVSMRWILNKDLKALWRVLPLFIIMQFSFCLMANVVAERYPGWVAEKLPSQVYSAFVEVEEPQWDQRVRYYLGGVPVYYLYVDMQPYSLRNMLNDSGLSIFSIAAFFAALIRLTNFPLGAVLRAVARVAKWRPKPREEDDESVHYVKLRKSSSDSKELRDELMPIRPETDLTDRPSLSRKIIDIPEPEPDEPKSLPEAVSKSKPKAKLSKQTRREIAIREQRVYNGDFSEYDIPQSALLTKAKKVEQGALKKNLRRQAEVLQETLHSFGIEAKVGRINCGPTITLFEVHPAIGVKVQKIRALEHDIALNMEAKSIRIIAPIPGKAAVGIEVPNPYPQEVGFREMLATYHSQEKKLALPLLLGKTVNGENVIADLAKMPHLIIAGATGSGKSVCINTIVMSLLMNARPDEVKLMMVDPKKVELTAYSELPHMLAPVITEPQGACAALNWLVKEMERRYDILKTVGVRNIRGFNSRTRDEDAEAAANIEIPEKLPYIVGIIDELADLMMVSSSDIETPVARIAQMARAVGIHMVLATQRPSREVITGLIKANFPTRIAFKVASRVNSQIILDETGAETLLGNGDMLFLPPGSHNLVRAQGAFIRDEDILAVVQKICKQAPPQYVIQSFDQLGVLDVGEDYDDDGSLGPVDSLYQSAVEVVNAAGTASTTFLQRKLKIGYARAASIMDQLEDRGVIGPAEGSKPRKVLAGSQESEDVGSHGGTDDYS